MWEYINTAAAVAAATGDESHLAWLIPVCAVSLIAVIVLTVVGKKRK